jgi:hypothetical protein
MRDPNAVHVAHPLRMHELAPDFTVEDVWVLPAVGAAGDFPTLLDVFANLEFQSSTSLPTRVLWGTRACWPLLMPRQDQRRRWNRRDAADTGYQRSVTDRLPNDLRGKKVQLGAPIPGSDQTSLTERLPVDLRDTAADVRFDAVPFTSLHRTHDEFAAEISNRTVHTVMHVGGPARARAGTGARWPSTSNHVACSARPTWRSSSRSRTSSSIRRSCGTSDASGRHALSGGRDPPQKPASAA